MADLRKLKDRAAEHFQKGRFAKAAEVLKSEWKRLVDAEEDAAPADPGGRAPRLP